MFISPQLHSMFCVVYQLCRVRGAKAVVQLMPHEASELEPVIHALQAQVRVSGFDRQFGVCGEIFPSVVCKHVLSGAFVQVCVCSFHSFLFFCLYIYLLFIYLFIIF